MKLAQKLPVLAFALALAVPAFAGKDYTCTHATQQCLDEMAAKLKNRGWVGIELDDSKGMAMMAVTKVIAGSPAEVAGFKEGDVLKKLNGVVMSEENEAQLKPEREKMIPGGVATYTVARAGKDVDLSVTLAAVPENVLAQWVGSHMLAHVTAVDAPAKTADSPAAKAGETKTAEKAEKK